ncbi:MAG TPA: HAMP domain-containing protein, partial [Candidatus Binataceae bacterium]|nr:HAMP domain-containing protein [Candidatus Binataceae bacterium]
MHSRLLRARVWLDHNGLFPRGKLAFFTLYVLGVDLLLLLIEKSVAILRPSATNYLGGWTIFLTLLSLVLLIVLGARWLSAHALWRMRNRLIVTYVFIGIVPLILLAGLAVLSLRLFSGQFATYIVSSRLNDQLQALRSENSAIARQISASLDAKDALLLEQINKAAGDTSAWLSGKQIIAATASPIAAEPPQNFPSDFSGVVEDGGRLFLRAATIARASRGELVVVSSKPLGQAVLLAIASGLGEITLEQSSSAEAASTSASSASDTSAPSLRPILTAGIVSGPRYFYDPPVNLSTSIPVMNWADGKTSNSAAIDVQTRSSSLYDHLFSAPGAFAYTVEAELLAALIGFGVIVVVALWIGTRLTRSITSAVGQLYRATTHINRADFSHRISVTSNDQLAALANSFNSMTASIEKLILEQKEKQRLENEITIAQEVQSQLFPRRIAQLPSLEVHGFCRPARSVSGDYYDFLSIGEDRLLLA